MKVLAARLLRALSWAMTAVDHYAEEESDDDLTPGYLEACATLDAAKKDLDGVLTK